MYNFYCETVCGGLPTIYIYLQPANRGALA